MIKKLCLFVCLICLLTSFTVNAQSLQRTDIDAESIQSIILLEDGASLIIMTPEVLLSQRGIITGQKEYYYKDANGVVQWTAILTGTFTYNGSSATCTAASCVTSVQHGNWSESYNHAYPSGGTAQADITMVRKVLFITVQTETAHLVLSCDANGNLS